MTRSVLVVEDEVTLAKNIQTFLHRQGFEVHTASDGAAALSAWSSFRPDLVLLDYQLGDMNGLDVLRRLTADDPGVKAVLMTGHGDVRLAVTAMKAGAADYLSKPLVLEELKLLLDRLIDRQRIAGALDYYQRREADQGGLHTLLGESPAMQALHQRLRRFIDAERRMAAGEMPPAVLVSGETGTGKELVARAFHFDGLRRARPFVELNCAALPAQLLEAELFGFERGAFTDAKSRKPGLAEVADGGTLFLDEIGELDLGVQAKLLRVLEEKRVRRLGAVRDQPIDVRIIAASNRNLDERVAQGAFRADLLFRLRIIQVDLPPLRNRGEDIVMLATAFLDNHARRYGKPALRLSAPVRDLLRRHPWPGNVRELRNVIEQAVLLLDGAVVEPDHLSIGSAPETVGGTVDDASEFNLERLEQKTINRALQQTGWNITRAAQLLGISRDTLRYRLEKYRLKKPDA